MRDLLDGSFRHGIGKLTTRLAVPVAAALMFSAPVAAQSGQAAEVCSGTGVNLLISMVYVVGGLSVATVIMSALAGAGLISMGWAGRKIRSKGTTAMIGSIAGMILLTIVLTVVGLAYAGVGINIPSECMIPI